MSFPANLMADRPMSLNFRALVTAALIVTSLLALAGMASGPEIKTAVTGKTIHGNMDSTGPYAEHYTADGVVHGKDYKAKWSVEGDKMCWTYEGSPKHCWTSKSPAIRFVG